MRYYRTETVDALYAAMEADAELVALVGQPSKIIRNDKDGRIRRMEWRSPADFAFVEVLIGPTHSGDIQKIQSLSGDMDFAARIADFTLECVWGEADDTKRDSIEAQLLAIAAGLVDSVEGVLAITFRSSVAVARVTGSTETRDATRIVLSVQYLIPADDLA